MKHISSKNFALFIILGIAVFIALIFIGEYASVIKAIETLNPWIILLLVALTFMNILLRFAKWEYFLRKLDIRIPARSSFLIFLSGITMAITPGKVGEVLKSYLLKQSHGVKVRKSIMVVFTERLTDILGVAILSLAGLSAFLLHAYALVFVFVLVFVLIFILTSEKHFSRLLNILVRLPFIGRYKKYIMEAQETSRKLLTFRSLSVSTAMSVLSWFFECLALFILLDYLGSPLSIFTSTFIFSFSSIFGSVLVLPGGLGAAEGSFIVLLLLSGVPRAIASTSTIIIRIATLWFGVFLGLAGLFVYNRTQKKVSGSP
jgi:uncharacterized protein (TIRG00374 family)